VVTNSLAGVGCGAAHQGAIRNEVTGAKNRQNMRLLLNIGSAQADLPSVSACTMRFWRRVCASGNESVHDTMTRKPR